MNGYYCCSIGGLNQPRLRAYEPRPVGSGGGLSGTGSMIGNEKQRSVPRLSRHATGAPLILIIIIIILRSIIIIIIIIMIIIIIITIMMMMIIITERNEKEGANAANRVDKLKVGTEGR